MKSTRPTAQIREQVESSRTRERRTESLYRLSCQLAGVSGSEFLVSMAGRQVQEILGGEVVVLLLRRKIEIDSTQPRYLLTEQGVGYRLAAE